MIVPHKYIPMWTLYRREVARFGKVFVQTVASPAISSGLYLLIFGVSLGASVQLKSGMSYLAFIVPGLVMMSVLNNSFQNSSSSVVSGKFSGDLEDWKVAPIQEHEILIALSLGGLTRGLTVGLVTYMTGQIFYYFHGEGGFLSVHSYPYLLIFLIIGGVTFALFGITVAFWSRTLDQVSAINSFVLLPLIYLGGVFFSLDGLHPIWQAISRANPLLYFINGVRYGLLGVSDVPVEKSLVISLLALVAFFFLAMRSLKKGSYFRW